MKSRSDNGFVRFFSENNGARLIILAVIGAVLLFIGTAAPGDKGEAAPDEEAELAELCSSIDGVGRCRTMISRDASGDVVAVVVLCEGAESIGARSGITEMISSIYGIGYHRITVLKLGGDG